MTAQSSLSLFIRPAKSSDVAILFGLINALAGYEKLAHEVTGSAAALQQHLFGEPCCIEAILAEDAGQPVGFALFFVSYATALMQPKIYLEDLFVLPDYRGTGIGKALLSYLAQLAVTRNYGRMEWSVLDWNQSAIGFYQRIGAQVIEDIRVCRITADQLPQLAFQLSSPSPVLLRTATLADCHDVFALVKSNIEYDGGSKQFDGTVAQLTEHLFNPRFHPKSVQPYAEVVIAEQDTKPVGLALFCINYSTFLTKPGLFIEDLFVQADYRGQGIGKALLAYLAQQAIDRGYGRLEWHVRAWNQPTLEFYQGMGAKVLPDWRICQLNQGSIQQLIV